MNKTKRLALILVACVLVIAAVVGVSFAVWSNLEKDHVFTLKAGTLELNISSFDVLNSDKPISFDNPVTMSFKVKVEGEKSTLRFGINSFEYSLVEGQFLPLSPDLFDVELPKTMYGVGGKEEPEIVECLIKVSLTNAYDYDSFDPVLMGKKFRFNIHVKAETYTDPVMYDIIYNNVDGATHDNIAQWSVETNYIFKDAEKYAYIFGGWYTDPLLTSESRITELTQDDPNINTLNVYAKWIPIKYAITYDFGSGYQPENIPEEYTIEDYIDFNLYKPLNDDPTLLFGGYYLDAEFTKPITEIKAGTTGAIDIYAKWVKQYNITYIDRLSVENANPIVFSALDDEIILSDLTADGYVFDGWYNALDEKVFTIDTLTESDIELTAKWIAIPYSITWNPNGGTLADGTPESYTIESEDISPSAFVPARNGYTFDGWFTDEAFLNPATTITNGSTGARIFYAKWTAISYSITWNENGGTLADGTPESYDIESLDIDPSAFVPTRNGYEFNGWFTDVNCLIPAEIITTGSTENRIFYAKWTAIPYSITWNENGGTLADGTPESYTIESDAIDPSAFVPTRNGYTFDGWFTDEAFLSPATTITNGSTGARIFYAKWTAISYSITWNENGGTLADGTPESYDIESLDIDPSAFVPTRNGYEFNGWFTDVNCLIPAEIITTGSTENRIFYAKWTAISYSITWNENGGTLADGTPESYTIESEDISPSAFVPTRNGYTFDGWFTDEAFLNPATTITNGSTGARIFYAKWTATPQSITWNPNGGTLTDAPESYTIESEDIDPSAYEPTREGYEFNGWFTDVNCLTPATTITKGSTGARTFYAKWIANTYKITWEYSGGNEIVDIITEYTYDKAVNIESYVPIRNGYTFDGWYLDDTKVTEIAVGTIGDITIVASWIPTPQSITWNPNGGTLTGAPESYTIESPSINPNEYVPTRDGYSFDGWYVSNDLIYQAEVIATGSTGVKEFYAKWNIVTYTLEWELNDGTSAKELPTTYDITHPDNIITLVNMIISKKGYKFLGWYDNAEFAGEPITKVGAGSVGNYKLFAKWELVQYTISYFSDYGDATILPDTYTVEEEIDFTQYTLSPYPDSSNYRFAGFYTDEAYNQSITMISKGQTGNINIYVKWLEVYTITWNLGDGATMEATPPAEYTAEDTDIDLTIYQPTKEGFNFLGWNNGTEIVTSIPTGSTGNIALTAQWEEITVQA